MTDRNQHMYDDFQLVYNNLASNLAPGLDIFEISMYLTKACYSFVTSAYQQYEKSEAARKSLIELVRTKNLPPTTITNDKICDYSTFFALTTKPDDPDDILFVVYEHVLLGDGPVCLKGKTIKVVPVTHDDFHQVFENPFKANKRTALRLDLMTTKRVAEIVYKYAKVVSYKIRYIKRPNPIILDDLTGTDKIYNPNTGLGESSAQECELNPMYDKDIVRLAAQMAYQDYKAA